MPGVTELLKREISQTFENLCFPILNLDTCIHLVWPYSFLPHYIVTLSWHSTQTNLLQFSRSSSLQQYQRRTSVCFPVLLLDCNVIVTPLTYIFLPYTHAVFSPLPFLAGFRHRKLSLQAWSACRSGCLPIIGKLLSLNRRRIDCPKCISNKQSLLYSHPLLYARVVKYTFHTNLWSKVGACKV